MDAAFVANYTPMKPIRPWLDYKKFIESLDIKVIDLDIQSYKECLFWMIYSTGKHIKTSKTIEPQYNEDTKIFTVKINHGLDLIYSIYIPCKVKTFEIVAGDRTFKSDYPQDKNGYISFETPIPLYHFINNTVTMNYSVEEDIVMNYDYKYIPKIKLIYVLLNTDDRNVLMRSNFHYTFGIADAK